MKYCFDEYSIFYTLTTTGPGNVCYLFFRYPSSLNKWFRHGAIKALFYVTDDYGTLTHVPA